jgi:hypothetical protein
MNRSIRSFRTLRHTCALLVAMLAVAVAMPAVAGAQNVSPTDEEYGNGVLGVAASGDPSDPADPVSSGSEISSLPFTGLDVAAIAAIGIGLVAAGFVVRRAAHTTEDTV